MTHFTLSEFLPEGYTGPVPAEVLGNLDRLMSLLNRARDGIGAAIRVTSGWRPPAKNARAGGVQASDHLTGCAADCQALATDHSLDPAATIALFLWLSAHGGEELGQLIMEDHRFHYGDPGKLWTHCAVTSDAHRDRAKVNRILISDKPKSYRVPNPGELS